MNKIVLKSPAKLNLFLKVLGKRPDGYHNIETVFERIALFDKIILKKRSAGIELISNRKDLPTDERNLAYKAAQFLLEKTAGSGGVSIQIEKFIPIGAGLGGGSSNAASVLLGLNRLYDFGLGEEKLLELSRDLGADVAFFVHECSFAKGEFKGDIVTPIDVGIKLWHVLAVPPFEFSTKDIYESISSYHREREPSDSNVVIEALKGGDLAGLNKLLYNSLEKVALGRCLEIGRLKEALFNLGTGGSLVSGSGPAVFCLTRTRREAIVTQKKLKKGVLADKKDWLIYVARTM